MSGPGSSSLLTRRQAIGALLAAGGGRGAWAIPAYPHARNMVRIAVPGWQTTQAFPAWAAQGLGLFLRQRLQVRWLDGASDVQALQQLRAGEADLGVIGLSSLCADPPDGLLAWRVLLHFWQAPQVVVLVSRHAVERYVAPAQLTGLRIGLATPGASGRYVAQALLMRGGVAPSAVDWVPVGTFEGALTALSRMDVHALVAHDPAVTLLEREFAVQVAADTRTPTGARALLGGPWIGTCLVARADWVAAYPALAQAAVSAFVAALNWLQTAQAGDLARLVPNQLAIGQMADHVVAFEKARSALAQTGRPLARDVRGMLQVMRRVSGVGVTAVDSRRVVVNEFAERAWQSLAR